MGTLNDVVITKLSGGLGRRNPDQDMVSGLLFHGNEVYKVTRQKSGEAEKTGFEYTDPGAVAGEIKAVSKSVKYGEIYRLASVKDAEAIGITAKDYDSATQSAYYQIEQFFRMNPSGDLFIMVAQGASYDAIVAQAKGMQEKANGAIRQMAVIYSGTVASFGTKDGEAGTTTKAVQEAQVQANNAYKDYMPFELIIEGKKFVHGSAIDLKDLGAENVSVVVAMDAEQAKKYTDTAAVGMTLGAISRAKVSENIAWIEKFNLSGKGFGRGVFVGGNEVPTLGTLDTLNEKKYIFARTHTGLPGVYFNDSHTCTLSTSDFTYIENNRTINKATRLLRTALLPRVARPIAVDPASGQLSQAVVQSFENLCVAALEGMVSNQEVSAFDVYVDPKQNILATSELRVKAEVTPIGTARKISVDLGFKNPFGVDKA